MEINLTRQGNELVYSPEICLYDGENLKVNLDKVGIVFGPFKATINGQTLGLFNGTSFGIHSSKLKEGVNEISICPTCSDETFTTKIVRRIGIRGTNSYEEEITRIFKRLDLLQNTIDSICDWKEEIDSERSGY